MKVRRVQAGGGDMRERDAVRPWEAIFRDELELF